jgi:hypothetical protein
MDIDDSALLHRADYDPQKAHEYYLRNRKLKGRQRGPGEPLRATQAVARRPSGGHNGGKPNRADTKSRQAELRAQKEHLEKRLERLREELKKLVDAAKARSGVKKKEHEKDKAPETPKDKADRNKDQKKDKPLSPAEKHKKAQKAKEAYEKEHPNSLSEDVEILQLQIKDIHAKIEKALADARERRKKAGQHDSKSGSRDNTSGPRGR